MTIRIREIAQRRYTLDATSPSAEIAVKAWNDPIGTPVTDADILAAVQAWAPVSVTVSGKTLTKIVIEFEDDSPPVRKLRLAYSLITRDTSKSQYNFETGGGTVHVDRSLQTIASHTAAGGTPPSFNGAIGVTPNGIEGADIIEAVYQFSETHFFEDADVDAAYKLSLFNATGKTNNATFKGFAAGEALFLGASGTKSGDELWQISFKFSAAKNQTGLTVGTISGIAKKGWEYLWTYWQEDTDQNQLIRKPRHVYIEKVYEAADFSTLGIGT